MAKNAHKVVEMKNKNYVTLLMNDFLLKYLFRTSFNFKVIPFLENWSLTFSKISRVILTYRLCQGNASVIQHPERHEDGADVEDDVAQERPLHHVERFDDAHRPGHHGRHKHARSCHRQIYYNTIKHF